MAIANVICEGFGPSASIGFVIREGFGIGVRGGIGHEPPRKRRRYVMLDDGKTVEIRNDAQLVGLLREAMAPAGVAIPPQPVARRLQVAKLPQGLLFAAKRAFDATGTVDYSALVSLARHPLADLEADDEEALLHILEAL